MFYHVGNGISLNTDENKQNYYKELISNHKHEFIVSEEQAEKLLTFNLGGCNVETLFNVIVITQNSEIFIDKKVVSKSEETAKYKSGVYECLKEIDLTPDDVTIIVKNLGSVKVADK